MKFLGTLTKTRGNKGEVVLRPSPLFRSDLNLENCELILKTKRSSLSLRAERVSEKNGQICIKFEQCQTIAEGLKLVGREVFLNIMEHQLDDGLSGYRVLTKDGQPIGMVSYLQKNSFNQLIVVKDGEQEILIPFQPTIVIEIDHCREEMIVDLPPGLVEL